MSYSVQYTKFGVLIIYKIACKFCPKDRKILFI
jgi:hypothetical protein